MTKLEETVKPMRSADYKERMRAEYWQTKIRYDKLHAYITKIRAAEIAGTEAPPHDCPVEMLRDQAYHMGKYLHILELRAGIEGVEL